MRYVELFENKEILNQLIKNPKFQNWFKESKVVDSTGRPELVFHYSASEYHFDKFNSFSHFGTNKSAEERFDYFYDKYDEITQIGFTVPCFLNIKKPMFIEDFQSSSNMLAYDLYINDKISFNEFKSVTIGSGLDLINAFIKSKRQETKYNIIDFFGYKTGEFNFDDFRLIKILKSKGYDGFCYINDVEDKGSMSWTVFHSNQVWRLFSKRED